MVVGIMLIRNREVVNGPDPSLRAVMGHRPAAVRFRPAMVERVDAVTVAESVINDILPFRFNKVTVWMLFRRPILLDHLSEDDLSAIGNHKHLLNSNNNNKQRRSHSRRDDP